MWGAAALSPERARGEADPDEIKTAYRKLVRTLQRDPEWTRDAIAARLGVSHMTVYRELKRASEPETMAPDKPLRQKKKPQGRRRRTGKPA